MKREYWCCSSTSMRRYTVHADRRIGDALTLITQTIWAIDEDHAINQMKLLLNDLRCNGNWQIVATED